MSGRIETNFGASTPYTVGIEEEFQLVHPVTKELSPAIDAVLAARDAAKLPAGCVASELSASCLETRSPVRESVPELATELHAMRQQVRELVEGCGACLVSAGTHPFSEATAQPITDEERYHRMEKEMGWTARMQAIYGLHVHVAVPNEEHAIRAVGVLARHVPLFIALSANSPFWSGSDTRLASARAKILELVPRSGLPPHFRSWVDFENHVNTLVSAGSIPDYTWCWWDVRPHPKLGTVELRAPDAQTEASRAISLAALAQCLVATADEHHAEDPLLTGENKWQAIRHGLDARLQDFSNGYSAAVREVAQVLVETLRPVSQDLGCQAELESILEITDSGTGADRQRAVLEKRGSLESVVGHLVSTTSGA